MEWETVVGLEIHAQLATKSKIFSGASTRFGAPPNSQACAVDLGLPGVLPVLNREVVSMAVKFGLAIEAQIATRSVFARKNYFYPDLPKGYQISQYERPIIERGRVRIADADGLTRVIGIHRAHLEEDAGKSLHEDFHGLTGIDLNRAGTPLLEIVSEPELSSAGEAVTYAKKIHSLVRYLDICDGNMQEGSFRCDANVSVRPRGQAEFGTRTELKNLNSFRFMERAINYEVARQIDRIESGKRIVQETRLYDADLNETRAMRTKEEANDYRYFPDPDLLPVHVDEALIAALKSSIPELPDEKYERFMFEYGLSADDAMVLTSSRELADYYEAAEKAANGEAKIAANWVLGAVMGALNKSGLDIGQCPVTAERLGAMLCRLADGTISGKLAKRVFESMWQQQEDADTIIEREGLQQVTDSAAIEKIVDETIARHPEQRDHYRAGKEKLLGFFVGQIMKQTHGKANPAQVNAILKKKLAQ